MSVPRKVRSVTQHLEAEMDAVQGGVSAILAKHGYKPGVQRPGSAGSGGEGTGTDGHGVAEVGRGKPAALTSGGASGPHAAGASRTSGTISHGRPKH